MLVRDENTHNAALRLRSGTVVYSDSLTSFLYSLMISYLVPGDVEKLVWDALPAEPITYSNGWLAHYAHDIANRLAPNKYETQRKDELAATCQHVMFDPLIHNYCPKCGEHVFSIKR